MLSSLSVRRIQGKLWNDLGGTELETVWKRKN